MRIAIYCRVSTEEEEQQHSLQQQEKYYRALLSLSPEHTLVGVYAEMASGLSINGRPQFKKMIKDCKKGKIDLIITKSLSRFSRNTVEFLETIRDLKVRGVDVWFETQQILLSEQKGEFIMSAYVAALEQESRSRSESTQWGLTAGMRNGTSKLTERVCYGYTQDEEGKLLIDAGKADNVKLIFDLYLQGYSLSKISKKLHGRGILTPTGKESWTSKAVDGILSNEKYTGDVLLQKTYVPDFLTGGQKKNEGQKSKFLYENNHIGIITKEVFDRVQKEKERRNEVGKYSSKAQLSGKIYCGECGASYWRTVNRQGKVVWKCGNRGRGGSCKNRSVKQEEIDGCLMGKFKSIDEDVYKKVEKIIVKNDMLIIE